MSLLDDTNKEKPNKVKEDEKPKTELTNVVRSRRDLEEKLDAIERSLTNSAGEVWNEETGEYLYPDEPDE